MPFRFRVFDSGPDDGADRYTVIDTRPYARDHYQGPWRAYFGMSGEPFHPQGVGMHGEMSAASWYMHCRDRFRALGKRIQIDDLPPNAKRAAKLFIAERTEGEKRK